MILWIDDDPERFNKLSDVSEALVFFAHGREQIEHYLYKSGYKFDLVILDHDMPLMNGAEVCEQFLWEKNIPVILCSNNPVGRENQKWILMRYDDDSYQYPLHDVDISRRDFTDRVLEVLKL
jgi:CheY-like chemotaxis protein